MTPTGLSIADRMPAMKYNAVIRIFYFLLMTFVGLVAAMIIMAVMLRNGAGTGLLRVATVVQDVLVFIIPPVVTALMVTGMPARLLAIDRLPLWQLVIGGVGALACAIPALNWVVEWNEGLTLPAAMEPLEQWMKQAEEAAQDQVELLLGAGTVADLVMNVLIVGIMAGVAEEIFFRGGLQRLLASSRMNHHWAIWITAILFSAFHMQFYGFFPRMLLGAFFGYLLYWSGSLWLPVMLHALNNSVVVITDWMEKRAGEEDGAIDVNSWGSDSVTMIVSSVILTALVLYLTSVIARRESEGEKC